MVVELARARENAPVVLLYASGPSAESDVRVIFVATVHERVARLLFVVARDPERVL